MPFTIGQPAQDGWSAATPIISPSGATMGFAFGSNHPTQKIADRACQQPISAMKHAEIESHRAPPAIFVGWVEPQAIPINALERP